MYRDFLDDRLGFDFPETPYELREPDETAVTADLDDYRFDPLDETKIDNFLWRLEREDLPRI
ncbi:MAG: hypothetical protein ABEJ07_05570 [Candidatus Nanohaloarchaea archaeon]